MYAENVQGHPSRYPGHGRELADGLQAVLDYHDRKHAESLNIFRALTPEQLAGKCATPPIFGLTEEEVRARSATR